jgi:nucleotide-binding universal stress UspA family protein
MWQFYDEVTEDVMAELHDAFAMAMGGFPADVPVRPLVLEGGAGQTLVSTADRDNDVIVVGAGTRRGLRLGTRVARYCLRHADCNVLVVPAPRLARLGRPSVLARRLSRELNHSTGPGDTVEATSR